jgi:hypothetical protein
VPANNVVRSQQRTLRWPDHLRSKSSAQTTAQLQVEPMS